MPPLDLNLLKLYGLWLRNWLDYGDWTFSVFVTLAGQNIEISDFASVLSKTLKLTKCVTFNPSFPYFSNFLNAFIYKSILKTVECSKLETYKHKTKKENVNTKKKKQKKKKTNKKKLWFEHATLPKCNWFAFLSQTRCRYRHRVSTWIKAIYG